MFVVMPQARIVVTINRECSNCHNGVREQPFPLHSFDWHPEGYPLMPCNNCGHCRSEEIITPYCYKSRISTRSIKSILKTLCERGRNFDYSIYKEMKRIFQKKDVTSEIDLANDIAVMLDKYGILMDRKSIDNVIYKKVSYSS